MSTTRPPFVDAHVHLWDLAREGYAWLRPPFSNDGPAGSIQPIATTYLPEDYRDEVAQWNMVGYVHVEAGAGLQHAHAETLWLHELADRSGQPDALVASVDLACDDVIDHLRFHASYRLVKGIRHQINWHPDPRLRVQPANLIDDERWCAGFERLADFGLSFDLQCYPQQASQIASLIERNPHIPVIVNHLGMPLETDFQGLDVWRRGLRDLASNAHVSLKLSGAGFVHRNWSADSLRPYVLDALDIFGTERIMVASNFPTDRLFNSMNYTLGAYEEILEPLTFDEKCDVWGRNANRIYRLGLAF